jgi:ribosomal protein S18 acetylase RimI-like enzyme
VLSWERINPADRHTWRRGEERWVDDPVRVGATRRADVAAVLARAFQDDPLMRYVLPDAKRRARTLPWLVGLNVGYCLRYGEVFATPALTGAALWLPPGSTTPTPWRMVRAGIFVAPFQASWRLLGRLAAVEGFVEALHRRHAPPLHWYLSQLGVEPAYQGRGIGGSLLRPVLSRLDSLALACYLETMNGANVPFYRKWGFAVVAEARPAEGGPHTWAMLRAPREIHPTSTLAWTPTMPPRRGCDYTSGSGAAPARGGPA